MIERVKNNFNKIVLMLAALALIFVLPVFVSRVFSEFNEYNVFCFIEYALIVTAAILIIIGAATNNLKTFVPLAFVSFILGLSVITVYTVININSWSSIVYLVVYAGAIVLYFIKKNDVLEIISWVLLLAVTIFGLIDVFNGSYLGVSELSIMSIVVLELYLFKNDNEKENLVEGEEENE